MVIYLLGGSLVEALVVDDVALVVSVEDGVGYGYGSNIWDFKSNVVLVVIDELDVRDNSWPTTDAKP